VRAALEGGQGRQALKGASSQCLAALIKLFLRNLPDDIWSGARDQLEATISGDAAQFALSSASGGSAAAAGGLAYLQQAAQQLLYSLQPLAADLVVWVCDVMVAVVSHEETNRMSREAVSTVFAPGLVHPPGGDSCDPATFMEWTEKGVMATSLLVRVHSKQRLLSRPLDDAADDAAAAADDAEGGGGAGDDGAGDGGAPRRRRARLSVEDRAAGLNALLAEMDVTKPSAAALPIS